MKPTSKKITGFLFLFLAVSPLLFILSFKIQQQVIRYRMKERLEKQLLQSITIDDKNINWAKEGEEIWINGKMFDIETIKHHVATTTFTGLFDNEETVLMHQLDETQKQDSSPGNKFLAVFFQLLQSVYNDTHHSIDLIYSNINRDYILTDSPLSDQFLVIFTPPPQAY